MGGRKPLMTPDKITTARRMYEQQELTVEQIARAVGVSRSTIYRALNRTGSIAGRREQPDCVLYPQRVAIFLNGLGIHPHLP